MNFIDVKLNDLVVNPNNDRHGPKNNEQNAINWLFSEHRSKMLSLAKDIVEQGAVYDPPLVKEMNGKFIVFDGNRRVTCLKALCSLCDVPAEVQSQFAKLREKFDCSSKMTLSCQIEDKQDTIDQIVSRRHNGTDGGRGQLSWDARAKQNHAKRIGAATQYPIAEAVEEFLQEHGYPHAGEIKRSTLFRLINAKRRQKQFGIELSDDGSLKLLRDANDVLAAFSKVADDILEKKLTLTNVLNSEGVNAYMKDLEKSGLVEPTFSDGKATSVNDITDDNTKDQPPRKKPERRCLIPAKTYDIDWPVGLNKVEKIWQELQFDLQFSRHGISIPILFRTLIELLTDHAVNKLELPKPRKDKLSSRVGAVAEAFAKEGLIETREYEDLKRLLGSSSSPRELEALHRCVHGRTAMPAKEDLVALWTGFEHYLLYCIEIKKTEPRVRQTAGWRAPL